MDDGTRWNASALPHHSYVHGLSVLRAAKASVAALALLATFAASVPAQEPKGEITFGCCDLVSDCSTTTQGACGGTFIPDGICSIGECCPNGNIANVSPPITRIGSTSGANNSHGNAPCSEGGNGGDSAPDVSFFFTPTFSGTHIIDTVGSSFDTILKVQSGGCATEFPTIFACNDDISFPSVLTSSLSLPLTAGQRVLIVVDGFNTASGNYVLNITTPIPTPTLTRTPTRTRTRTRTATVTQTRTRTRTRTPTLTPTRTRTSTRTPTATVTPTPTPTPTHTATVTPTPSSTPTPTATHTPSPTSTASPTSSPTCTPTASPTPTSTRTATATPSDTPTASPSPTPLVCTGDCSGDDSVDIAELSTCVAIGLEMQSADDCRPCDGDRDGTVDVPDLIAARNNGFVGCPPVAAGSAGEQP